MSAIATGRATLAASVVLLCAAAGSANAASVSYDAGSSSLKVTQVVNDSSVTVGKSSMAISVAVGAGDAIDAGFPAELCVSGPAGTLRCTATAEKPITAVEVFADTTTGTSTITGTSSPVRLKASVRADGAKLTAQGSAFDDELRGGGGDDLLFGKGGNDTFVGGLGNDLADGDEGIDTVRYDGDGRGAGVTAPLDDNGSGGLHAPAGEADGWNDMEKLVGTSNADVLSTSAPSSTLEGGEGNDKLTVGGAPASVTLDGGGGDDSLQGHGALLGGPGNDRLVGSDGDDRLDGGDGSDGGARGAPENGGLFGGAGGDVLIGGSGADDVHGGAGGDTVDYSAHTAGVTVSVGTEAGSGNDLDGPASSRDTVATDVETVTGTGFDDIMLGGGEPNTFSGLGGNDRLAGGGGIDSLAGGEGSDDLNGAGDATADVLDCGAGADKVAFDSGLDTVRDCLDEDGDGIEIPADCNDADGNVKPGAAEIAGNAVDEDCDGVAAALPPGGTPPGGGPAPGGGAVKPPLKRLAVTFTATFATDARTSRPRKLRVGRLPAGSAVELRCAGPRRGRNRCAFKTKRFKYARATPTASYESLFKKRKLPTGTVITITVSAPDTIGRRLTLTVRGKRKAPKRATACITPGSAPGAC